MATIFQPNFKYISQITIKDNLTLIYGCSLVIIQSGKTSYYRFVLFRGIRTYILWTHKLLGWSSCKYLNYKYARKFTTSDFHKLPSSKLPSSKLPPSKLSFSKLSSFKLSSSLFTKTPLHLTLQPSFNLWTFSTAACVDIKSKLKQKLSSFSVGRLRELLTCYDASDLIVLGERYGYNVHDPQGYNYVTGGGGIVLSRPLLRKLSAPGVCDCPSISTPDDMFLGICIATLGVQITHSPLFHQVSLIKK